MPAPSADRPRTDPSEPSRPAFTPLRVLGVTVFVLTALFWVTVSFVTPWMQRDEPSSANNPDYLEDRAWVEQAEETCTATMARIDRRAQPLPDGDQEARARAIEASTRDLRTMLEALASPLPRTESDREVVRPWLADWEQLLDDRDEYAAAVRRDADARFLTGEKFGDPLDSVVELFADVNQMPSCGPAGDVG